MTDISTSGWDVVSMTDINTVNAVINANRDYPEDFAVVDENAGDKIELDCQWGKWTVTPRRQWSKGEYAM